MKKLLAWLNKHGYKFEPVNFGNDYFYNAAAPHYSGATVCIESDNINEIRNQEQHITKYCNRYNYDMPFISRVWWNYTTNKYNLYITIRTGSDAAASENYEAYATPCRTACENLIHEYHEAGKHESHRKELNEGLKKLMDYYGALYNRSLIKQVIA